MHGIKSAKIEISVGVTYIPGSCARLKPWQIIDTNNVQMFMATNTKIFKAAHLSI